MPRKRNRKQNRKRNGNNDRDKNHRPNLNGNQNGESKTPPDSGYRQYLDRCAFSGVGPVDFETYLIHARRWRTEYGPAKHRKDFKLMQELEQLLCV